MVESQMLMPEPGGGTGSMSLNLVGEARVVVVRERARVRRVVRVG